MDWLCGRFLTALFDGGFRPTLVRLAPRDYRFDLTFCGVRHPLVWHCRALELSPDSYRWIPDYNPCNLYALADWLQFRQPPKQRPPSKAEEPDEELESGERFLFVPRCWFPFADIVAILANVRQSHLPHTTFHLHVHSNSGHPLIEQ
jgi:hypothetical protein